MIRYIQIASSVGLRALCWSMVLSSIPILHAGLAITEVMSSPSTNLGAADVSARSDFWELTNFGTNVVDLTNYRFNDSAGIAGAEATMFSGRSIAPGESIIFAKAELNCSTAAEFRAWWGDANLPPGLQIYFYGMRGFSADIDAVQLWQVSGGTTTLVQRVELSPALRGRTFTYDPELGLFNQFSELGKSNVFKAVLADDIGSPGFSTGPAPLVITQQPQSLSVPGGEPAILSVAAGGLPEPRFQWRFNGVPINGATSNRFEINPALPEHEGTYTVQLTNGLTNVSSIEAVLHVNPIPAPPRIVTPPGDLTVAPGQTASFHVNARGYPLPSYQWRFNNEIIPDATNATLQLPNVNLAFAGYYSVHLQNDHGTTNSAAILTVVPLPNLKVTEMMGSTSTNSTIFGRGDWWELTNFDTNALNLRGYRFDDSPGVLEGSVVITNDLIIKPGESVLFIQDMTPDFFMRWWGAENLPENVQFFSYSGNGFNASNDNVVLWNASALDPGDFIVLAEYYNLDANFVPFRGISLNFWCDGFLEFGTQSELGVCGGIKAAASDDIASPGYITDHPPRVISPRALKILRDGQGAHLTWKVTPGLDYELFAKNDLSAPGWTHVGDYLSVTNPLSITDALATNITRRFYQLRYIQPP